MKPSELVWIDGLLDSLKALTEAAEALKEQAEDPEASRRRFADAYEAFHEKCITVEVGTIRLEKVGCEREAFQIRFHYENLDSSASAVQGVNTPDQVSALLANAGYLEQYLLKARAIGSALAADPVATGGTQAAADESTGKPPATTAAGNPEQDDNPTGKVPAIDVQRSSAVPPVYLNTWREILITLGLKNNREDKQKVSRLNRTYSGPINIPGQGKQPFVDKAKLLEWWASLEAKVKEARQREQDAQATIANRHDFHRDGEVVPDISGGVTKRRRDRKP